MTETISDCCGPFLLVTPTDLLPVPQTAPIAVISSQRCPHTSRPEGKKKKKKNHHKAISKTGGLLTNKLDTQTSKNGSGLSWPLL